MNYSEIMVRYGELSTKGKNRRSFIMQLASNVKRTLADYPHVKVHAERDRMHLLLNGENSQEIIPKLQKVFGIQNFSPSIRVEKDIEVLKKAVQDVMAEIYTGVETFKITAKRSDHSFVQDSNQLNLTLGNAVIDRFPDIKVQMKKPDINLRVEIRIDGAYLSYETIQGAAGLPVGTSGKGMLMLSGGIDSPVAGYFAMKRGVEIEAVQTLHSMVAINEVTNTPIVRPVATMDKLEIIEVAEAIDTFELSVQPFEDCCTIFAPPQPKTRPRLDKVHQYEERLDIEGMMERAMAGLKLEAITANQEKAATEFAEFL